MRSNPPFDPRMQPMGMYVGGPSQVYMQPMMHPNAPQQANYQQIPIKTQNQPHQTYPINPQPHPQFANEQVRVQRQQAQPIPAHMQAQKPPSVAVNKSGPVPPSQPIQQEYYQNHNQDQEEYQQNQGEGHENYEQGYAGEEEQQMKNQQIIMFWQHKFYTILQRFQLIFEKVQWIRSQFYNLNNELKNVDSEEEWNDAKDHHEDFMEQLEQFSQELAGVINENANLVEQNQSEHNDHNIWKERYFELFQGYKAMEQELGEIKESKGQQSKINELMTNYRELEREYGQISNELAELKEKDKGNDSSMDKVYRDKLDFALKEAEKYKETLDQLHKENEYLTGLIDELKSDKHNLEMMLESNSQRNLQQNFEEFNRAINQRDQQINLLNKQLKQLSQKYNFLVQTHNDLQSRMQEEEPRIKSRFGELEQQINSKNSQIMEYKGKLHELELKEKSTQSVSEEYQKLLKIRTTQLQERSDQIIKLRKELVNTSNLRRNQSEKDLSIIRKEYEGKVKKIQAQYEEKIQSLKKKLRKKEQEIENTALLNIKIESLQKKNKILLQEIQNLSSDLNSRQKQSIELKRIGHIQEKVKELEYQYNLVVDEREHLNAALLQRNYDVESLQSQINEFEGRIKTLSENPQTSNSKQFINEIEELNKLMQMKENQINKLKATLNLKEGNIKQLDNQLERVKGSLIANEKLHSREKDALSESIRVLERKNQENQKKMRELEYQFGSIMKKNLEEQIKNLRAQNQAKQESIIRLQSEQLQLRTRISHHQRIRSTHTADVDELTNRIKQLQTSKFDMIKKVETSYRDIKNKQRQNKELIESAKILKENITKLEIKISENEKLIQEKDKIIENIEGQLLVANSRLSYISEEHDSLRLRRRDQTDLLMKESDDLRRRIFEFEHLNDSKREFKEKFAPEITKIENQMIQQLKEQKEFLKSELAVALQQIGNIPTQDKLSKTNSPKRLKASQGIDYIQKRLFDFNSRLDEMITKNKQLNVRGFGSNIQNSRISKSQNSEQIKSLKNQIQELRKYISKLEVEAAGETIRFNPKNEVIELEHQKINNQRIQFYQKQNSQLEARIQSLIKVNTQIKERVDSLLKDGSSNSAIDFYKSQLAISEETIESLHAKVKKLMEENRTLKSNNSEATTKMCRDYEDKIFECENKIFMLERKVSALELQKNKSQNAKIQLQRSLNLTQTQLQSLKYSSEKQIDGHKRNNKQLTDNVIKFETEMAELLEKVRMLESENSRLSQAVHSSYSQQHIFLNTPIRDVTPKAAYKR